MLEIKTLGKMFGNLVAVEDFSLSLKSGKITSLIGPNGAGKTTVFNIISGYVKQDTGEVLWCGNSLTHISPWRRSGLGIARTFQNLRVFRRLTVLENIDLAGTTPSAERFFDSVFAFSKRSPAHRRHLEWCNTLLESVGLQDRRYDLAENLSYGQQKLLSMASSLATGAILFLLDEPVAGVQPQMIDKILAIMKNLVQDEDKTIFLIEHNMGVVKEISDSIVVMDEGKKIAEDKPSAIFSNSNILEAYLT